MGNQGLVIVEADQQVLGPSVDAQNRTTFDALRKAVRQRDPEVATALQDANQTAANQPGQQAAANGFDLGKLRHSP